MLWYTQVEILVDHTILRLTPHQNQNGKNPIALNSLLFFQRKSVHFLLVSAPVPNLYDKMIGSILLLLSFCLVSGSPIDNEKSSVSILMPLVKEIIPMQPTAIPLGHWTTQDYMYLCNTNFSVSFKTGSALHSFSINRIDFFYSLNYLSRYPWADIISCPVLSQRWYRWVSNMKTRDTFLSQWWAKLMVFVKS